MDRTDPLHVPSEKLVVYHNGKEKILLNKRLLDQQNCWENLEAIKFVHSCRLNLEDLMTDAKPHDLKKFDLIYTELETILQTLWGFEKNPDYHRFWSRPGCACPKMDNEDSYPSGFYFKAGNCPLHGEEASPE